MTLGNPWGLLALLALPLIVFLHRRSAVRRRPVPLLALWRPAATTTSGSSARLRDPLLLLRLLLVTAVAFALSRPGWPVRASARQVLVLDASASLKARAAGSTRLEEARRAAREFVTALSGGDEAMVVRAGLAPTIVQPWSRDRRRLREAIDSVTAGEGPKELVAALALSGAQLQGRAGVVHVFSDSVPDPGSLARQAGLAGDALLVHHVGEPADNLAIVGAATAPSVGSPLDHDVFALVANFSAYERSIGVTLTTSDGVTIRRRLRVPAGRSTPTFFRVASADWVEIALDQPPDALPVDDHITLVLRPRRLRVLHVGGGDRFVAAALEAAPGVTVTHVDPADLAADGGHDADVAVFEGASPPAGFSLPVLQLEAPSARPPRTAALTTWARRHPLLSGLDLREVWAPVGRPLARAQGQVLLDTAAGPVAIATMRDGRRRVEIAFAVAESTLGYSPAFPALFLRSLYWLADGAATGANIRAGQPLDLPVPLPDGSRLSVRRPDGTVAVVHTAGGRLHFVETDLTGRYLVTGPGIDHRFAVNLVDPAQSDLRLAERRPADGQTPAAPSRITKNEWLPVRMLLAVALQCLSLETWLVWRTLRVPR